VQFQQLFFGNSESSLSDLKGRW